MVSTRDTTTKRELIGEMDKASKATREDILPIQSLQLHTIHGEEISQSSRTTTSSLRIPTNSRVKFEKHKRDHCTYLNIRLKVVHKKDTTPIEATREAFVTLFKLLQESDEKTMLAKYEGAVEQGEEEAIEKTIHLPSTLAGLKRYAKALRPVKKGGGMVWTSIILRHDVPILELICTSIRYNTMT